MATFPDLTPSTRTLIPGDTANNVMMTLDGASIAVRQSSAVVRDQLSLSFDRLTASEFYEIVSHYAMHGTFQRFELASGTLAAITMTIPTGYLWRYTAAPKCSKTSSKNTASIDLELLPPEVI